MTALINRLSAVTDLPLSVLLGTVLTAVAPPVFAQLSCTAPQQRMLAIDLLFGRGSGGLKVSETAWTQFLAREITPRFPDGLTVIDASGQWRSPQGGAVLRERSKVVMIVVPETLPVQERIDAIATAYKRQFKQQSVGIVIRTACASF